MRAWKQRLQRAATQWLALPPDTVADVPRMTCIDGRQFIVENVDALRHVSDQRVIVETGQMTVDVEGVGFQVTLLTDREVHIQGDIRMVKLNKGGSLP